MSDLGFIMVTTVFVLIVEFVAIMKSNHDEAEAYERGVEDGKIELKRHYVKPIIIDKSAKSVQWKCPLCGREVIADTISEKNYCSRCGCKFDWSEIDASAKSKSQLNYDNCDLADCEKYFKKKVPVDNDRNVIAGQVYRHFKGHTVKVLHIAQDTEAPGQFYVVYECEDGAVLSRPYGMFVSEVDRKKYPDVKQKYRFELMESENDG